MKQFSFDILKFIPVCVIVYMVLTIVSGELFSHKFLKNLNYIPGSGGHLYTRLQEADTTDDVDILFLGSSHAYRGYDTRIFEEKGFDSFNLGSSAQTFLQSKFLLEKYVDSLNPKLVIFDVYPKFFNSDGIESTLTLIANGNIDADLIKLCFQQNNIIIYNTLIFGLYRRAFDLDKNYIEPLVKEYDRYIEGGFVESYNRSFKEKKLVATEIKIYEEQIEAFESILEELRDKNIDYVLVRAPVTKSSYESFTNNETINDMLSGYGLYLNFNENKAIELEKSDFYDHGHLQQDGVRKYNEALLNILYSKGILEK